MADEVDYRDLGRLHEEALRTIERMFSGVRFTPEEQRFVEDAGRKLSEYSFDLLVQWPQIGEIRPMVVLYAMAAFLGAGWTFNGGIPQLRREPHEPGGPAAGY
jgi:hypothetical protein